MGDAEERTRARRPGERRVVVGVSGSLGSLTALHRGADESRRTDAVLVAVLAWVPPGGELAHRRAAFPPPEDSLRRAAAERLLGAVDDAFGPDGPGVPWEGFVVRGTPGPALVDSADRAGDVLVIGAGRRGGVRHVLFPNVVRYCVAHACCPVLAVPPSPLQDELAAAHRRLGRWRALDTRDLTDGRT
ncbi:universal stress protein [Streptomyces aureoverticillatus]|uniref:universal stress protein n=1 Tax=Streptomyces aureoverticillatus TaxID=66871 RepID=UPI0013DA5C30|nr:universal stress protein [Streptomyces aureoverticillatus]QIB41971.1 universal stress protein [Streptomyces aureoverticillatus]